MSCAIVTGASRGIGKSIALTLAQGGYNIVLNYRNENPEIINLINEIESLGVKCLALQKDISIFDVIGPNMIGPSSSHTAGALRISLLAYKIAEQDIKEVKFVLYGSFAQTYRGHGTDRALLAGIMGFGTEDERIRDAFEYADKQGLKYTFETNLTNKNVHPNTVEIIMKNSKGEEKSIMGESIGGGNVQVKQINGIEVMFTGKYSTIIVRQKDRKGVVAHITKSLSDYEINIAFMRLYRTQKGETAYTIIEADQKIDRQVADKIMECENIEDTTIIDV